MNKKMLLKFLILLISFLVLLDKTVEAKVGCALGDCGYCVCSYSDDMNMSTECAVSCNNNYCVGPGGECSAFCKNAPDCKGHEVSSCYTNDKIMNCFTDNCPASTSRPVRRRK